MKKKPNFFLLLCKFVMFFPMYELREAVIK